MYSNKLINLIIVTLCYLFLASHVANGASSNQLNSINGVTEVVLSHFQPMVAMLCGRGKFYNQYLDENKRWVSDPDPKAVCTKDKLEILEYCRKVYPKKDIRNIVEYSKYMVVENWCKVGQKCGGRHAIKPYRCLEGPFQSDALLVPAYCLFDHIHNGSICQSSEYWNRTAAASCAEKRKMKLKSFGMLLPCGVGIFGGVEFVCCPAWSTTPSPPELVTVGTERKQLENQVNYKDADDNDSDSDESQDDKDDRNYDEDDEYYDDEYQEDDEDDEEAALKAKSTSTTTTTTTTTTTERPIDHYLSHFDSSHEHDSYKAAQKSLEESHRDKVTKVMKEWSELEERYQEMKMKDPKGAAEFKRKMTSRFQKTVEALEEEGSAERRQLISMHQQRVMTVINMRKKAAMDCYTQALDQTPLKTKRIEKCLEKLLRALEKDRTHTLHHFRHLLSSNTKQALREKSAMLDHLENLLRMGNHSILMLDRVPSISSKIRERIIAFWHNLRGIGIDEMISRETEQSIMERYEEEVAQKQQEHERQKMLAEERQQLKELEEEKKASEASSLKDRSPMNTEAMETSPDGRSPSSSASSSSSSSFSSSSLSTISENDEAEINHSPLGASTSSPSVSGGSEGIVIITESPVTSLNGGVGILPVQEDNAEESNAVHKILPTPKIAFIHNQGFHHNEMSYSVRKEPYHPIKWNGSVYITLAFAGIALLMATVVGIVLLRNHRQRSPLSQGFVEVDQAASPEERHVANMQINGYENPTYKYFETQSA